jgi:hypothetical protein
MRADPLDATAGLASTAVIPYANRDAESVAATARSSERTDRVDRSTESLQHERYVGDVQPAGVLA